MKNAKQRLKQYGFGDTIETGGGDPANPAAAPTRLTPNQIKEKYKANQYVAGRENWGERLDTNLGNKKTRDVIANAGKTAGVDPSLLYSSSMEEGMNLRFSNPNATSEAYQNAKVNAKSFPIDGFYNYGLDTFSDQYQKLSKKGYLPEGFDKKFSSFRASNEIDERDYYNSISKLALDNKLIDAKFKDKYTNKEGKVNTGKYYDALDVAMKGYKGALPTKKQSANTAAFADDESALMAKAAMIRDTRDQLDDYGKKNNVKFSDKQRDFFTLAGYNGGTGNMREMIKSYGDKGYLKDDKFLSPDFTPASYPDIYTNTQRRLQNRNILKTEGFFATGGEVGGMSSGMEAMLGQLPAMANMTIDLIENNPKNYSRQPTLNADTMRQMVTPYALGGDTGEDDDVMAQLQAMADAQGIPVEELIEMLQNQQGGGDEAEAVDNSVEEEVEEAPEGEDFMASQFAYGGVAKKQIEVEDNEVLETPDGKIKQMQGKTHEDGGIPVKVPNGTKIYSDRLKIDGKTMQARKLNREKRLKVIERQLIEKPGDKLLQGSYERTLDTHEKEEAMDMALQKFLSTMFNKTGEVPEMGYGGKVGTYAYGGVPDIGEPVPKFKFNPQTILDDPYALKIPGLTQFLKKQQVAKMQSQIDNPAGATVGTGPTQPKQKEEEDNQFQDKLTAGDYVGMAGNLFNAVAPIINTNRNRQGQKPNINRYLGFGHEALNDNADAQTIAGQLKAEHMTDIETDRGTAGLRNRNSAMSVNTLRALDSITDMGVSKAKQGANDSFTKTMMGLMTQRGQLENINDRMEMAGEERRDTEDKADRDNYYSNMAENLVNAGTNVQGLGKNINQSHENSVNAELISQLSQFGLGVDPNTGKLVTKKKK